MKDRATERDLAAHFQAHKEDEGEWEEEPTSVRTPAKAGMVYSIRFTAEELAFLREVAEREGTRISDLVHHALADYIRRRREPIVELVTPPSSRVFIYRGEAATIETGNPTRPYKPELATVT